MKANTIPAFILAVFCVILLSINANASSSYTATKDNASPANVTGTGSFTISTNQTVQWQATATGSYPEGNKFYLSHSGPNVDDIPVSTSLTYGIPASGTLYLTAGTYYISINTALMGPGTYTIIYDLHASFAVSPTSFNFGNVLQSHSSSPHTFNLTLTGDMLPVGNITPISPDPTHFAVTGLVSTDVPSSFHVTFNAGTTLGLICTNLVIHGTNPSGYTVPDVTVNLCGTTLPDVPNIECTGPGCGSGPLLGTADGNTGGTINFNKSFSNTGTNTLIITSITLNDNEGGVFSLNGSPSISPLAPGSRNVSIHFAPPPGEHVYCGSILIVSNDPDHPSLECFFTARAHHPVPIMVVEETDLDYHEVELGFSYTKAVIVRNDGDANLVMNISEINPADPDIPQWSSVELATAYTIHPGDNHPFKATFTPTGLGGPYSFQESVTGNDIANPSQTVTLHGSGIAPVPIDNVLVLDRSGSMIESAGTQTKIEALQKAANLYVDLLRNETGSGTGDKFGIVKYNQTNSVYLPLDFKTAAHYTDAQNALNDAAISDAAKLGPSGTTSIGGGMQTGAGMAGPSLSPGRQQVMIVMTDGKENTAPYVADVLGAITTNNPDLQLYSLGLGDDIDVPVLQSITNKGAGGFQQVSGDLLGNNMFALEEFYFKIYSNATGANLIVDPTQAVNISSANPVDVITARVVSSDRYATFLVMDDPTLRKYYSLQLIDPGGHVINLGSSVGGIPVQVMSRLNYTIYKVIFPDISHASSYVGDWILRLNPNGKWQKTGKRDTLDKYRRTKGEYIQPSQGLVPIGFAASVRSDYNMAVTVSSNEYKPGALVKLTATLTDRGWPSEGVIHITSTKPDGTTNNFSLYDDGTHSDDVAADGIYTNSFSQTSLEGTYKFFFDATGKNERGELVPRQATRYLGLVAQTVSNGRPCPCEKVCFPCWAHWILLVLILVVIVLIIRCCRRMKAG